MSEALDPAGAGGVQPGEADQNPERQLVHSGSFGDVARLSDDWLTPAGVPRVHWLLIQDRGVAAHDLTQALVTMLRTAQVHLTVRTIDDYLGTSNETDRPLTTLKGFSCVLLVLPSGLPAGRKAPWKTYAEIVKRYRELVLPAAEAYRRGAGLSQEAGVIQVFYREADLDFPEVRSLLDAACDSHCYSDDDPAAPAEDVFRIFPSEIARKKLQDEVTGSMLIHWRDLKKWGVESREHAQLSKRFCDERRQALEDSGKRAMYRPIPGIDKNRLDLLLTESNATPPIPQDATDDEHEEILRIFRDNGARAVRNLLDDMIEKYPWFHRPVGKEGRKFAQVSFVALYRGLQIVTSGSGA